MKRRIFVIVKLFKFQLLGFALLAAYAQAQGHGQQHGHGTSYVSFTQQVGHSGGYGGGSSSVDLLVLLVDTAAPVNHLQLVKVPVVVTVDHLTYPTVKVATLDSVVDLL
jgi:hypothetical protein